MRSLAASTGTPMATPNRPRTGRRKAFGAACCLVEPARLPTRNAKAERTMGDLHLANLSGPLKSVPFQNMEDSPSLEAQAAIDGENLPRDEFRAGCEIEYGFRNLARIAIASDGRFSGKPGCGRR